MFQSNKSSTGFKRKFFYLVIERLKQDGAIDDIGRLSIDLGEIVSNQQEEKEFSISLQIDGEAFEGRIKISIEFYNYETKPQDSGSESAFSKLSFLFPSLNEFNLRTFLESCLQIYNVALDEIQNFILQHKQYKQEQQIIEEHGHMKSELKEQEKLNYKLQEQSLSFIEKIHEKFLRVISNNQNQHFISKINNSIQLPNNVIIDSSSSFKNIILHHLKRFIQYLEFEVKQHKLNFEKLKNHSSIQEIDINTDFLDTFFRLELNIMNSIYDYLNLNCNDLQILNNLLEQNINNNNKEIKLDLEIQNLTNVLRKIEVEKSDSSKFLNEINESNFETMRSIIENDKNQITIAFKELESFQNNIHYQRLDFQIELENVSELFMKDLQNQYEEISQDLYSKSLEIEKKEEALNQEITLFSNLISIEHDRLSKKLLKYKQELYSKNEELNFVSQELDIVKKEKADESLQFLKREVDLNQIIQKLNIEIDERKEEVESIQKQLSDQQEYTSKILDTFRQQQEDFQNKVIEYNSLLETTKKELFDLSTKESGINKEKIRLEEIHKMKENIENASQSILEEYNDFELKANNTQNKQTIENLIENSKKLFLSIKQSLSEKTSQLDQQNFFPRKSISLGQSDLVNQEQHFKERLSLITKKEEYLLSEEHSLSIQNASLEQALHEQNNLLQQQEDLQSLFIIYLNSIERRKNELEIEYNESKLRLDEEKNELIREKENIAEEFLSQFNELYNSTNLREQAIFVRELELDSLYSILSSKLEEAGKLKQDIGIIFSNMIKDLQLNKIEISNDLMRQTEFEIENLTNSMINDSQILFDSIERILTLYKSNQIDMKDDTDSLLNEKDKFQKILTIFRDIIQELQDDKSSYLNKIHNYELKLAISKEESNRKESEISRLELQAVEREDLFKLKETLFQKELSDAYEKKLSKSKKEFKKRENQLSLLEQQAIEREEQFKLNEILLQQKLSELETECERCSEEFIQDLQTTFEELSKNNENLHLIALSKNDNAKEILMKKNENLQKLADEQKVEIDQLKNIQMHLQQLKSEFEIELNNEKYESKIRISELENDLQKLKKQLLEVNDAHSRALKLQEEVESLKNTINIIQPQIEHFEKEIEHDAEDFLNSLQISYQEIQNSRDKLDQTLLEKNRLVFFENIEKDSEIMIDDLKSYFESVHSSLSIRENTLHEKEKTLKKNIIEFEERKKESEQRFNLLQEQLDSQKLFLEKEMSIISEASTALKKEEENIQMLQQISINEESFDLESKMTIEDLKQDFFVKYNNILEKEAALSNLEKTLDQKSKELENEKLVFEALTDEKRKELSDIESKLKQDRIQIEELKLKVEQIQNQLQEKENLLNEKEINITKELQEIELEKQRIENIQSKLSLQSNESLISEINQCKDDIHLLQNENMILLNEKRKLEEALQNFNNIKFEDLNINTRISLLRSEIKNLDENISQLSQSSSNSLQEINFQIQALIQEREKLKPFINLNELNKEQIILQKKQEFENTQLELNKFTDNHNNEIVQFEESYSSEIDKLKASKNEIEDEIKFLSIELDENLGVFSTEIINLQNQLTETQLKEDKLHSARKAKIISKKIDLLNSQRDSFSISTNSEISNQQSILQNIISSLEKLESEKIEQKSKLNSQYTIKLKEYNDKIGQLKIEIQNLEDPLSTFSNEYINNNLKINPTIRIDEITNEINKLQEKINKIQYDHLSDTSINDSIENLKEKKLLKEKELSDLISSIQNHDQELIIFKENISELEKKISSIEAERNQLSEKLLHLSLEYNQHQQNSEEKLRDATSEILSYKTTIENLESELYDKSLQLEEIIREAESLRQTHHNENEIFIDNLTMKIDTLQRESKFIESDIKIQKQNFDSNSSENKRNSLIESNHSSNKIFNQDKELQVRLIQLKHQTHKLENDKEQLFKDKESFALENKQAQEIIHSLTLKLEEQNVQFKETESRLKQIEISLNEREELLIAREEEFSKEKNNFNKIKDGFPIEKLKEIEEQEISLTEAFFKVQEKKNELDKKSRYLEASWNDLEVQRQSFQKQKSNFNVYVINKKVEIDESLDNLSIKQQEIDILNEKALEAIKDIEKRKSILENEIAYFERRKQEDKDQINMLREEIEKERISLITKEQDLNRTSQEINNREKALKEFQSSLSTMDKEFQIEKEKLLRDQLQSQENLKAEELRLRKYENEIKNEEKNLTLQEQKLSKLPSIEEIESKLNDLKSKENHLNDYEFQLLKKTEEINSQVIEIEKKQSELDINQSELTTQLKEVEELKQSLQKENDNLKKSYSTLEKREETFHQILQNHNLSVQKFEEYAKKTTEDFNKQTAEIQERLDLIILEKQNLSQQEETLLEREEALIIQEEDLIKHQKILHQREKTLDTDITSFELERKKFNELKRQLENESEGKLSDLEDSIFQHQLEVAATRKRLKESEMLESFKLNKLKDQLQEKQQEFTIKEKQLNELKDSLEKQKSDFRMEKRLFEKERQIFNKAIKSLNIQKQHLLERESIISQREDMFKQEYLNFTEEKSQQEVTRNEIEEEIHTIDLERKNIQDSILHLEKQRKEIQELEQSILNREALLKAQEEQMNQSTALSAQQEIELREEIDNAKKNNELMRKLLQEKESIIEKRDKELEETSLKATTQIYNIEIQNDLLSSQVSELRLKLSEYENVSSSLEELKNNIQFHQQQLLEINSEKKKKEILIQKMREKMLQLKNAISSLSSKKGQLQDEINQQSDISSLNSFQSSSTQRSVQSPSKISFNSNDLDITKFQIDNDNLKNKLKQEVKRVKNLTDEAKELNSIIELLREQNQYLEAQLQNIQSSYNFNSSEESISQLQSQLLSKENQIKDLLLQISNQKSILSIKEDEIKNLNQQLRTQSKSLSGTQEADTYKLKIEKMELKLEEKNMYIENLEDQISRLTRQLQSRSDKK